MESFVFASPIYNNKIKYSKVRIILSVVLHRRDTSSIKLGEEDGAGERGLQMGIFGQKGQ
jgi:hypothetical protein